MELTIAEQVRKHMAEVVAEFGEDYVYPKDEKISFYFHSEPVCAYVRNGSPSCLIGHVLHRMGVTLDHLTECEGWGAYVAAKQTLGLGIDENAAEALHRAQVAQDGGASWGEALRRFDEALSS